MRAPASPSALNLDTVLQFLRTLKVPIEALSELERHVPLFASRQTVHQQTKEKKCAQLRGKVDMMKQQLTKLTARCQSLQAEFSEVGSEAGGKQLLLNHTPPPPAEHEGQDPNTSVVDLAFCTRHGRCSAAPGTPAPSIPPARTVDGANGAGDGPPPQRAAGRGAERGGGARGVRWPTGTEDSSTGDAASQPGRAAGSTGAGQEAHRGAVWRTRSHGADPRCSCAAVRRPAVGNAQE